MKKLIYVMFLVAGISFAAVNVNIAQETKAKAATCNKAQIAKADVKSGNCPMASANKTKSDCPKNCPMANKKDCAKDCPKANCPMKSGAVAGKKSASKTGPVALK